MIKKISRPNDIVQLDDIEVNIIKKETGKNANAKNQSKKSSTGEAGNAMRMDNGDSGSDEGEVPSDRS